MNEKNIVICDQEIRYANRLAANICERREFAVKVYACSSLEQADQLSEKRPINLFVVDEGYSKEERTKISAEQTFVISKDRIADLCEGETGIYKYQSADKIIQSMFETYMENTGNDVMPVIHKTCAKLVAVYSPLHRIGKTKFAITLGKALAKKKKVLYLNLEEYTGFDCEEDGDMNLGDLLYYMKQGNGKLGLRLQTAIKKMEELEYVPPIPMVLDLKEVLLEEWLALLEVLMQDTVYEVVILDIGESVQGLFQILELCDRIYMPVIEDEISRQKEKQYENNLEKLKLEQIKQHTYRFVMTEDVDAIVKRQMKEECRWFG